MSELAFQVSYQEAQCATLLGVDTIYQRQNRPWCIVAPYEPQDNSTREEILHSVFQEEMRNGSSDTSTALCGNVGLRCLVKTEHNLFLVELSRVEFAGLE
jgi:hypothetical protein